MGAGDAFGKCILAGVATALLASPHTAHAGSYKILHSFTGRNGDGVLPAAGVIRDSAGNLYGTTSEGGYYPTGKGVVFKIAPDGTETVLYAFCRTGCSDGANPEAGLIGDSAGNLYGTTYDGGSGCDSCGGGGTVFRLEPNGTETVLYNFCSKSACSDGYQPEAGVIRDGAGNLYGTTVSGGKSGCNGYNCGVVFKVAPDGTEKVLYDFSTGGGYGPVSGVIRDKSGNLYGTTEFGGTNEGGVVFKLAPHGVETVLYAFCGQNNCTDGAAPAAGVIKDQSGDLYGTTEFGGGAGCDGGASCGVVFEIAPNGTETVLHTFSNGNNGDSGNPVAGLIRDKAGNLYGTTFWGGTYNRGTVFKIAADGTATLLYSFGGAGDGEGPRAGLIQDKDYLYGTTFSPGIVFRLGK